MARDDFSSPKRRVPGSPELWRTVCSQPRRLNFESGNAIAGSNSSWYEPDDPPRNARKSRPRPGPGPQSDDSDVQVVERPVAQVTKKARVGARALPAPDAGGLHASHADLGLPPPSRKRPGHGAARKMQQGSNQSLESSHSWEQQLGTGGGQGRRWKEGYVGGSESEGEEGPLSREQGVRDSDYEDYLSGRKDGQGKESLLGRSSGHAGQQRSSWGRESGCVKMLPAGEERRVRVEQGRSNSRGSGRMEGRGAGLRDMDGESRPPPLRMLGLGRRDVEGEEGAGTVGRPVGRREIEDESLDVFPRPSGSARKGQDGRRRRRGCRILDSDCDDGGGHRPPSKLVATAKRALDQRTRQDSDSDDDGPPGLPACSDSSDEGPPPRAGVGPVPAKIGRQGSLEQQGWAQMGVKRGGRPPRRRALKSLKVGEWTIRPSQYVYLRADPSSNFESDDEVEDCRICGEVDLEAKLECDDCLGGFHLGCLNPPLKEVPEGDWFCPHCQRRRNGEAVDVPGTAAMNRRRTARERLLAKELSAVRILKIWKEPNGSSWFSGRRYIIPEDTRHGRQPGHGRRELFRTNRIEEYETKNILRECFITSFAEFMSQTDGGDDCFFCAQQYDEESHTFKPVEDMDDLEDGVASPVEFEFLEEEDDTDDGPWKRGGRPKRKPGVDEDDSDDSPPRRGRPKKKQGVAGRKPGSRTQGKTREPKNGIKTLSKSGKSVTQKVQVSVKAVNKQMSAYECGMGWAPKQIPQRETEVDFKKAIDALDLAPASLPCRKKERDEIANFLEDAFAKDKCLGRSLYISGIPGTGKTALVMEVIKEMKKKRTDLAFVNINATELPTPGHLYARLHLALTGEREGNARAFENLNKRFAQAKSVKDCRPCVVLLDEMDTIVNRTQNVLYHLFHWPTLPNSQLVVIGIANTMDLPEKMHPKIASRMGQRMCFAPYTHTQLQEIVTARLAGLQVFDNQALEFASRKISANTGDARRVLELCKKAVQFAERRVERAVQNSADSPEAGPQSPAHQVGMKDIDDAVEDMFQDPAIQMMTRCAKDAKIFLVAMAYEAKRTSVPETTFEKVLEAVKFLCSQNNETCPDTDSLIRIGSRLGGCRVLLTEHSSKHRLQKLQLNCTRYDVAFALKGDKEVPWLQRYLVED